MFLQLKKMGSSVFRHRRFFIIFRAFLIKLFGSLRIINFLWRIAVFISEPSYLNKQCCDAKIISTEPQLRIAAMDPAPAPG